jgi:hypothetical protein
MIQANKLRIGNYVFLKSKNKIWEITCGQEIDRGKYSNDFQPIPLTKELLIALGFKRNLNGWFNEDETFSYSKGYAGLGTKRSTKVDYVHQLQNLYFALTGKELTLKQMEK